MPRLNCARELPYTRCRHRLLKPDGLTQLRLGAVMHTLEGRFSRLIKGFGAALFVAGCSLAIPSGHVAAQGSFSTEQIQAGSKVFAQRCATCHGQKMQDPDTDLGAFDLRYFPRSEHDRFVRSVKNGKDTMPAWGDLISAADIEALWAYICAGEK